jgi:4-amino-4-deoxy-L-arabinose transferase-like glycosyltransferase
MDGVPLAESNRSDWLHLHRRKILFVITLLAGVMRFAWLDRPPLWLDEAMTYSRVCGSFKQMLEILRLDGFPPLHYEMFWLLGKCVKLTPGMMRVIPALQGTLMVPAIYFLAVQMVGVRTALLTAAFTASSAYMMAYSHDGKMYMGAWLLLTVHMACLLWWLNQTGRKARVAWLAWVAAGLAMGSTHYTTLVMLGIEPLIFLTARRVRGWNILFFILGVAIIAGPPASYFLDFSHWRQQVQRLGFAQGSGLAWVRLVNFTRGGPDLILHTATAYLLSWEWPTRSDQARINPDVLHVLMILSVAVLLVLGIAALPWRRSDGDSAPQPRWKTRLWLAVWIVPVAYGWYCASTPQFASPLVWLVAVGDVLHGHWGLLLVEIVVLTAISQYRPAFAKYVATSMGIVAALILVACLFAAGPRRFGSVSEWHDSYWPVAAAWWKAGGSIETVLIMAGVLPMLAWHFSGQTNSERLRKSGIFILTIVFVVALCVGVYCFYFHRVDRLTRQMMVKQHLSDWSLARHKVWLDWSSVWVPRYLGIIWPAVAISVCALLMRLPGRMFRYVAITVILGINLGMGAARLFADSETPMDKIVHDIAQSQGSQPTRTILCHLSTFMLDNPVTPSVPGMQGRYYLSQISDQHITPEQFRDTPAFAASVSDVWNMRLAFDTSPAAAASRLRELPDVRRLIIWDVEYSDANPTDRYLAALGNQWKLASQQAFAVRMHWTWLDVCGLNRREYRRINEATTQNAAP